MSPSMKVAPPQLEENESEMVSSGQPELEFFESDYHDRSIFETPT